MAALTSTQQGSDMIKARLGEGRSSRRSFLGTAAVFGGAAFAAGIRPALAADASEPATRPVDATALRPADLLDSALTYLNNATLGCCPATVIDAMTAATRQIERDPADEEFGPFIQVMEDVRAKAAKFLGCATDCLAITRNTTDGMNLVAQGLDLREGDHVLTTDQEHPGGAACWEYYAARRKVVIDRVELPPHAGPISAKQLVDLFAAKLTKATKVVSVSHVTYATGLRMPITAIAKLLKDTSNGALLVVDGAQAPGVLDVDVTAVGCHAYATSAHKGMLAPKGTGLLFLSPDARGRIDPLPLHLGPQAYTGATGTRDAAAIVGLGAAVDYLTAIGKPRIEAHVMKLRERLLAGLKTIPRLEVASPPAGEFASAIMSAYVPAGVDVHAFATRLREKYNVVVAGKDHGRGVIRLSPHLYNGERDVDTAIAALSAEFG
jgi:selenocysteine lyase/cysteine desulfurase